MSETTSYYIFPQAVVLIVLSAIVVILNIAPFIWYIKARNLPAVSLLFWVILLNTFSFINAIIWGNDNTDSWWSGHIYCDIESKLLLGSYTGAPGALVCVLRSIANILDSRNTVLVASKYEQRKDFIFMVVFCWAFPIYIMAVHYVVQTARYALYGIAGCIPLGDESWVTDVLVSIWPLILTMICVYYAILLIYRIHRYRSEFTQILTLSNTTKARFLRLVIMGLTLVLILFPIQIYVFYGNHSGVYHPYSWSEVHSGDWGYIWRIPSEGYVLFDEWIYVVVAFVTFCAFGTGPDAVTMYKSWMVKLGLISGSNHSTTRPSLRVTPWQIISDKANWLFAKMSTTSTTSATGSRGHSSFSSDVVAQSQNRPLTGGANTARSLRQYNSGSTSEGSTNLDVVGMDEILMTKEISTETHIPHDLV